MFDNLTINAVKANIGALIKTLRNNEGITQQQLAGKLGISRLTIQNIESGKNPTIDTLLLVLQHFDQLDAFNVYVTDSIQANNYDSLY